MNGAASIHVEVTVLDPSEQLIAEHDNEIVSYERTAVIQKDKYKKILGDSNARVSVSFSERMGGAYGYSSVSTNVTVTINCNQDTNTIRKAQEMAFEEAVGFTEDCFGKAVHMLNAHLNRYYTDA